MQGQDMEENDRGLI